MLIRTVRDSDLPALAAIAAETMRPHVEASGGDPSLVTEDFLRSTLSESRVLVAEVAGDAAAFIQYQIRPPRLIVNGAAVSPALQRKGMGERLFARAVLEAKDEGCGEVIISVQPSNVGIHDLYRRLGFRDGENPSGWNQEMSMSMEGVLGLLEERAARD